MRLYRIKGKSMEPAYQDGTIVLVIKPRTLRAGLVYIVDHPDLGRIVKRLKAIDKGRYFFAGDNRASTPEALISPVKKSCIVWRVFLKLGKIQTKA